MAASMTITVAIPTSETRAIETAWAARAAELAARAVRAAGGTVTSGNIAGDGGQALGTWSYTPQATS